MTKNELLKFIDEALRVEEEAVTSYAKHISSTIEFGGFDPSETEKIFQTLRTLESDSRDHASILRSLRESVAEDTTDVY